MIGADKTEVAYGKHYLTECFTKIDNNEEFNSFLALSGLVYFVIYYFLIGPLINIILWVFFARVKYIVGVTYNVKNVEIIIPPKIVAPTANLDVSPAPGPILPITSGSIAIMVLIDVIIIGLNLRAQDSLIDDSILFPVALN